MWLQVVFFVLFNGVPSHTFSVKYGFIEQHLFLWVRQFKTSTLDSYRNVTNTVRVHMLIGIHSPKELAFWLQPQTLLISTHSRPIFQCRLGNTCGSAVGYTGSISLQEPTT